jgi:site-specific recombinase XerD
MQQPNANRKLLWRPPRGIRYSFRADRPTAPFYLHWRDSRGKREAQGFADDKKRELAARKLAEDRHTHGSAILDFDPVRWTRYKEFQAIVGAETDPLVVAREWKASRQGLGTSGVNGMRIREAVERYLALRAKEKSVAADTLRHWKKHLSVRLCDSLGEMPLSELTPDHIREWLASLQHPRTGQPMEPITKLQHRRDLSTFLERARREGWITRNPCELVALPQSEEEDVTVISPNDAVSFFRANVNERVVGRIALEAFGGLRYSSAGRIQKEHLSFEDRGIVMPGSLHKSRKRKYRQGHPDCLWEWLKHAPEDCWTMTPLQYREEKRHAFVRAKIPFLKNVWRHSFASYMIAKVKDIPRVAYLMQHKHLSTTEIYEGVATEANAERYFAITPASVIFPTQV